MDQSNDRDQSRILSDNVRRSKCAKVKKRVMAPDSQVTTVVTTSASGVTDVESIPLSPTSVVTDSTTSVVSATTTSLDTTTNTNPFITNSSVIDIDSEQTTQVTVKKSTYVLVKDGLFVLVFPFNWIRKKFPKIFWGALLAVLIYDSFDSILRVTRLNRDICLTIFPIMNYECCEFYRQHTCESAEISISLFSPAQYERCVTDPLWFLEDIQEHCLVKFNSPSILLKLIFKTWWYSKRTYNFVLYDSRSLRFYRRFLSYFRVLSGDMTGRAINNVNLTTA